MRCTQFKHVSFLFKKRILIKVKVEIEKVMLINRYFFSYYSLEVWTFQFWYTDIRRNSLVIFIFAEHFIYILSMQVDLHKQISLAKQLNVWDLPASFKLRSVFNSIIMENECLWSLAHTHSSTNAERLLLQEPTIHSIHIRSSTRHPSDIITYYVIHTIIVLTSGDVSRGYWIRQKSPYVRYNHWVESAQDTYTVEGFNFGMFASHLINVSS